MLHNDKTKRPCYGALGWCKGVYVALNWQPQMTVSQTRGVASAMGATRHSLLGAGLTCPHMVYDSKYPKPHLLVYYLRTSMAVITWSCNALLSRLCCRVVQNATITDYSTHLDGDGAILAHPLHRLGDDVTNRLITVGRDCCHLKHGMSVRLSDICTSSRVVSFSNDNIY